PDGVADQCDVLAAGPILIRREIPPEQRLESQSGQQRGGRVQSDELLRISAAGPRERVAGRQREIAEYLVPLLHFEETGIGEADAGEIVRRVRRAQPDKRSR